MPKKQPSILAQTAFDMAGELLQTVDLDINPQQNLYSLVLDEAAKGVIEKVLMTTRGNQSQAARILGINRATLSAHVDRLKITISV